MTKKEQIDLILQSDMSRVTLTQKQKKVIKEVIQEYYDGSLNQYCDIVGIQSSNFYSVMNGHRSCKIHFLNKLMSGVGYQVVCQTKLTLLPYETGQDAPTVDYTELEDELLSKELEVQDESDC